MRTFIFLLCSTAFGFTSAEVFSQNTKIHIDKDQMVSIDEVFDLLRNQTDYTFIYEEDLFKDVPKVQLKKGTIRANKLLEICFSGKDFELDLKEDKIIIIAKEPSSTALQTFTVSGTVMDTDGQPLPGANIVEKGTTNGTQTDFDGNFILELLDENAVLSISFLGFATKEISVEGRANLSIILENSAAGLDEVVIVGYGSQKKLDVTGSISHIDTESLSNNPGFRVDQMLQGKASGMMVTQENGAPGAASSIRIRGNGSISASSEPLFVIDGLLGGGDLSTINPSDIADINILKDASATAIYGSRGANGVILITTKKGSIGDAKINVNLQQGVQWLPRKIELINGSEYAALLNESMIEKGSPPIYDNPEAVQNVDWQDETMQTSYTTDLNVSTSGGSEKIRYYISGNYLNQEGIIKKTGAERLQFRANVENRFNDEIKIGVDLNAGRNTYRNNTVSLSPPYNPLTMAPSMPVYNDDGTYNYSYPHPNFNGRFNSPVALQDLVTNESQKANLLLNIYAEYSPFNGLVFKSTYGGQMINYTRDNNYRDAALPGQTTNQQFGTANISYSDGTNYQNENTLSYTKQVNENHFIDGVIGVTFQGGDIQNVNAGARGFIIDANTWNNLEAGDPVTRTISSGYENSNLVSYLGRLNYKYKNRYLFTVTGRYDGSSRLGQDNQWVFFPSAALGWVVSEEAFAKEWESLSFLKLKGSYGSVGNQSVGIYQTLSVLSPVNSIVGGQQVSGWIPGDVNGNVNILGNPDLKWEIKDQLDLGIEANFFNNRLSVMADYYKATTKDLLLLTEIPSQTGYTQTTQNVGEVVNNGVDITISSLNVDNESFKWNTKLTLSYNKNEVLSLGPTGADIITHNYTYGVRPVGILRVGESIGSFYGYVSDGIWKENQGEGSIMAGAQAGSVRYKDTNNDGILNQEDAVILGKGSPDWFGGFNTDFSYKGLGLSIFFSGALGADIFNGSAPFLRSTDGQYNHYPEVLDRWDPVTNPDSNVPGALNADREILPSDRWIFDASHIRLESVNLTYSIPIKESMKKYFKSLNLNLTGTNLIVWSPYNKWGYDPVINQQGGTNLGYNASLQGFDYGAYPRASTFSFGVNIGF
jgi:TonB-linked SusC/RagA family outer membrane protein